MTTTMTKKRKAALSKETKKSVRKADLVEMQAGPRSMQGSTLNYMSVGTLDPSVLAMAFTQADEGYITDQAQLFEMIEEQDPHIYSELSKRRRSVTGLAGQVVPPADATQSELDRTKELSDILEKTEGWSDFRYDLTDAIGKGVSASEIEWRLGETWVPKCFHFEPQRMFQTDRDTQALLYVKMGIPEPLQEWKWVVHEHSSKSGYIESAALFRVLAWTYAYKAYNTRDMQRFLEVYGLPLRLGKYPAGVGPKQRDELLRAVRNIGNDGAGVVPSNMAIEFIEAQIGKVGDFIDAVRYWEAKQSMAILGGTLTSQADGKSSTHALGVIHDKVRREIMLHDVQQIQPTINCQVIRPIVLLNGMFSEDRMPTYEFDTASPTEQAALVDMLERGAGMGMEIDVDWAHAMLQIPRAGKDAKLLVGTGKRPENNNANAALVRLAALARTAKEGDTTGAYAAQMASLCAPFEQARIQQIAALVAESGDFESVLAGLEALAINPAEPGWVEALQLGMTAANLAGRSEV
jgi:phage gp29-like protein